MTEALSESAWRPHCAGGAQSPLLPRRPTEGADPDDVSQLRALPDRPQPPVQAQIASPDAMLEASETDKLVQQAIANLDEDQRLLVELRDVQELSYQEIEEITGLPEGT